MRNSICLFIIFGIYILLPIKAAAEGEPSDPSLYLTINIIDNTGGLNWQYVDNSSQYTGGFCGATPASGSGDYLLPITCSGEGEGMLLFFDKNNYIVGTVEAGVPSIDNPCQIKDIQYPYLFTVSGTTTDAMDGVCSIVINKVP